MRPLFPAGCNSINGQPPASKYPENYRLLKTDWIDIFQFHNVSNQEALQQILASQGAYEAVAKARDAGKIRFIGISSHSIQTAMEAVKTGLFHTLQFPFNFIENDPANELFPFALQKNVGIIGMKPFGGGLLESVAECIECGQCEEKCPYRTLTTTSSEKLVIFLSYL
jgi:predicted aldo/keto reductase-like oxidoreductase